MKSPRNIGPFLAAVLLVSPVAHAQDHGEEAYGAWTSAFLVKKDLGNNKGMTFFAKALTGADHDVPDDTWRLALHIGVVEDTYLHTRKPEQLALIDTLLGDYMQFNGTDFSWNQWNDDLAWISIAYIRGYQLTGKQKYLDMSAHLWNLAYDRDWDDELGGGIWENRKERPGKEALSNNPFVISGVALYEATHDAAYLTKAKAIYAWVRKNLFDANTGQVNQGMNPPGTLSQGGNVYNSGTFIIAADTLNRVVGGSTYRDDAQKAIDYVLKKGPILRNSENSGDSLWAYWFVKALSEHSTANDAWAQYRDYLNANAQSSWANRDPQTNLTGNDWTKVYAFANTDKVGPMPSDSGVAIWQLLEPKNTGADGGTDSGAEAGVGDSGLGGTSGAGGTASSGGSTATGGTVPNGGSMASGGPLASGGVGGSGGAVATGGFAPVVDGGSGGSATGSNHSGCGCVVGAKGEPLAPALSSLLGLFLFAARRRKRGMVMNSPISRR